jgi:hypothetical protein
MIWRIIIWALAAGFLVVGFWYGKLTLYNLWLAGGPPTPHAEEYASRANDFALQAGSFLVASIILIVMNLWRRPERK